MDDTDMTTFLDRITDEALSKEVTGLITRVWGQQGFDSGRGVPCSHPCSLMRADFPKLSSAEYWVGEKTDGTRMFLVIGFRDVGENEGEPFAAFVDRAAHMYDVKVNVSDEYLCGTVFDGELVVLPDGELDYVIFDTVAACGYDTKGYLQSQRMAVASAAVEAMQIVTPHMRFRTKVWYPRAEAVDVYESAGAYCDGLILVPEVGALVNGTQYDTFKWKPAAQHTIDFAVDQSNRLWVAHANALRCANAELGVRLTYPGPGLGAAYASKRLVIVECLCVRTGPSRWDATVVRVREDKTRPNSLRVARATLLNIGEKVEPLELVSA
jgi:hypothetical protein